MMEELITDINPDRPDLITDFYGIGSSGNLRGKALEGFIRPTIKQFFTSENYISNTTMINNILFNLDNASKFQIESDVVFDSEKCELDDSGVGGYTEDKCTGGIISADSNVTTYYPSGAFNQTDTGHGAFWVPDGITSLTDISWIQYEFLVPTRIVKIKLASCNSSGMEPINEFEVQASNSGLFTGEEIILGNFSHPNTVVGYVDYEFINKSTYNIYRLVIKSHHFGNGANNRHIDAIQMLSAIPAYPIDKAYYIHTKDNGINISYYSKINSCDITANEPIDTDIKGLISFDGRNNWFKWTGVGWELHGIDLLQTGNTIQEIEQGLDQLSLSNQTNLDFIFDLKTISTSVTPEISEIIINLEK